MSSPAVVLHCQADGPGTQDTLTSAWLSARAELIAERNPQGYWVGELASSPLSTATAISALAIAERHAAPLVSGEDGDHEAAELWNTAYRNDLSELVLSSVRWLAEQQNEDGGWGDTDCSCSNLATTLLALSAFRMTGVPASFSDLETRAEQYIRSQGGAVAGLKKRYGRDKTFAVPILTNCALAGIVPWKQVPALPFELAAAPQSWFKLLQLPVVSYAIPALVAIGLAKHHHKPSSNPLTRALRSFVTDKCLALVTRMQPDSGGFLEATPLTSFVVMALASTGRADHTIVRRGVEFLLASVRPDGSWPIDTNLATWNTTLAINALEKGDTATTFSERQDSTLDWLLACQHTERHPFTNADPGGWAWTNLSGGVPDSDDTPGALLALHHYWADADQSRRTRIAEAVGRGIRWLLDLQNRDGGWPTFCRGWGTLPFDRSATDLTAHVLRALHTWRKTRGWWTAHQEKLTTADLDHRIDLAVSRGLSYLKRTQAADGSWAPLWFGNERRPGEENPVYGTSRVLQALQFVEGQDSPLATRGLEWLVGQQHASGGWGAGPDAKSASGASPLCSVEETAVAVEALLPWRDSSCEVRQAVQGGLDWLSDAANRDRLSHPAPIGLYFAKLWYYERLYPKSFIVSALGAAVQQRVASQGQSGDDNRFAIKDAAPAHP